MLLSAWKSCVGAEHTKRCTLFTRKPRAHIGTEIISDFAERIVVYGEGSLYLLKSFTIKSHGNSSQEKLWGRPYRFALVSPVRNGGGGSHKRWKGRHLSVIA